MDVQGVAKQIEQTGNAYVHVYVGWRYTKSDNAAFCSSDYVKDDKELTPQVAAKNFVDFMEDMEDGKYIARMKVSPKAGAAERDIRFMKGEESTSTSSVSGVDSFTAMRQTMQNEFTAQMEKFKLEMKIEGLEEKIKQLNEGENHFERRVETFYNIWEKLSQSGKSPSTPTQNIPTDPAEAEAAAVAHVNGIADKLGENTLPLLAKLNSLTPDELQAVASLDIGQVKQFLG